MATPRTTTRGFTLIEMIVALAIIAMLTAIGVPALVRMARDTGDDLRNAAREVTQVLRAAQTYAMRNNVDAAVVYSLNLEPDSQAENAPIPVLDGVAIVRRFSSEEYEAISERLKDIYGITDDDIPSRDRLFAPVSEGRGRVRSLPDGVCILPLYNFDLGYEIIDNYDDPSHRIYDIDGEWAGLAFSPDRFGFRGVWVLDLENYDLQDDSYTAQFEDLFYQPRWLDPSDPDTAIRFSSGDPLLFPAHIFRANGVMDATAGRARFELKVGRRPSWDFEDRFIYDPNTDEISRERGPTVEVFATSGRIHLASQ